ncbi:MAG TPA: hypothetical protein VLL54_05860 [Pyrinomonadaceae bacterium]|nr:hypothetical protein [Pyrinomonadaceae bacterium]
MRLFILTCLTLLIISPVTTNAFQSVKATTHALDHATIQRRRLVLVRSSALVGDRSFKKRAVVVYPVISGLDASILGRVRSLLNFKNIFDYSLTEYKEDTWLDEFSYQVNHNGNYLLDITFNQSGSAAYPDDQSKHFLINLKTGRIVAAADAFETKAHATLAAMVNKKLKAELKQIAQELKESTNDPEDARIASEAQEPLEFKPENLEDFSVSSKGVTFLYDAGYPHAIQAFQPNGKYFFSYAELKPFIRRDGPLGQFIQ